ncbi:transporter substrate-binding domain-containing protein [Paraglaciecola arctica]|uniref:transporter substrate-binding domain-containing protein n=1 Tax=Paraglaciecola arctica TaxID=1128911 RepID=UPI001C07AEF3|nr:transporter substrate-binding domain-containing protein [Paraglaciecola arctica]MBU3004749.1 transporter substrate-binding domain-containing protein [Paraglaciecola arctica]
MSLFITTSNASIEIIKHVSSKQYRDQQKTYYVALLQLAIDKAEHKFGPASLQHLGTSMVYQRKLMSLNNGELDVMWTVTSKQREQELLPIMIPILKGLIGYRVMVIQDNKQQEFTRTQSIQKIKDMVAIQGTDWADTDVLRANGFQVETSNWSNSFYTSLSKGHYDYFPRSILEPWAELKKLQFKNLVVESNHLLYYPAAMYFFVQKDNKSLAQRLEYGLNQAIEDGSFDQLFYNYPAHKVALSRGKIGSRVIHTLSNPFLPQSAPLADTRLWHQIH